jgi:hypothetical protein
MAGTAVDISAAMACTAKYIDLNGFLFKNLKGSVASQMFSSSFLTLTPAIATAGTLRSVNKKKTNGFNIFFLSLFCLDVKAIFVLML